MRKNIKRIIVSGNLLHYHYSVMALFLIFPHTHLAKKVNLSVCCVWLFSYLPQQIRGD